MVVFAVSAAWVGVVGAVVGSLIGFLGSWVVHNSERKTRIAERSREERKVDYAAFLTAAEESMHRFQPLAEKKYGAAENRNKADINKADRFYDDSVVTRYRVLKLIGDEDVINPAEEMKDALNKVRKSVKETPIELIPKDHSPAYGLAHTSYRGARDRFIKAAHADLERKGRRPSVGTLFHWVGKRLHRPSRHAASSDVT